MDEKIIYTLLLGSNLGDRNRYLLVGRELLEKHGRLLGASSIQESKAWGKTDQDDFLNQVVLLESYHTPGEMLEAIHEIEEALDRKHEVKWGPRTMDIDILYAEDRIVDAEDLKIPHPLISERQFTLVLLNEIAPDFIDPLTGKTSTQMLEKLSVTN